MIEQNYRVTKQVGPKKSIANKGSAYWDITLKGLKDNRTWTTYIDTEMKNFENWVTVLENPDIEYELGGLTPKDESKRIVNADSKPKIIKGGSQFENLFTGDF